MSRSAWLQTSITVIDTDQSLWEIVAFSTGQPSFQTDRGYDKDAITTASGGKSI